MLPVLVSFGPIKIYSYGLFLFLALFLGLYWWWKIGRDEHWDEIALFDVYFISIFSYLFFGRLVYVMSNPELWLGGKYLALLSFPGINMLAGCLGVMGVGILLSRYHGWEVWKAFDALGVVLSVIFMISAIGAMLNRSDLVVGLWGIGWSMVTFALISRVRKDFRFYTWYKGDSSVAKDGLAILSFVLLCGVYYLPFLWVFGVSLIILSCFMIYLRSGKNRGEELLNKILRRKRI